MSDIFDDILKEPLTNNKDVSGKFSLEEQDKIMNSATNILKKLKIDVHQLEDFFLTGSRAWGMETVSSDWDFICSIEIFERTVKRLEKYNLKYKVHGNFSSLYVMDEFGLYNIVGLNERRYSAWVFATKSIIGIFKTGALNKTDLLKQQIYSLFELLCGVHGFINGN